MVFITVREIIEMVILVIAIGYIFSGFITRPRMEYEIPTNRFFDWEDLKFSALIAAPAILVHELGHKFVGLAFGLPAVFHIWPFGLGLGVVLKLIGSPFLFLAPAFVTVPSGAAPLASALISFAGPGLNLVIFGISAYVLKNKKNLSNNEAVGWAISKKLNLFLFFFNLIPIPPLDGYNTLVSFFAALP